MATHTIADVFNQLPCAIGVDAYVYKGETWVDKPLSFVYHAPVDS
jgi:hypothetical protein